MDIRRIEVKDYGIYCKHLHIFITFSNLPMHLLCVCVCVCAHLHVCVCHGIHVLVPELTSGDQAW